MDSWIAICKDKCGMKNFNPRKSKINNFACLAQQRGNYCVAVIAC